MNKFKKSIKNLREAICFFFFKDIIEEERAEAFGMGWDKASDDCFEAGFDRGYSDAVENGAVAETINRYWS